MSLFKLYENQRNLIVKESLKLQENYFGQSSEIPYILINGARKGAKCTILSGVHGDELNGIQIIHKIASLIKPAELSGDLLLLPVANVPGFSLHSRYLPDRRDLNRLFPGQENGSEGSRLAELLWRSFIQDSDFGIDLHCASYNRWNFPHIRGNMRDKKVRELAMAFGSSITIHSKGVKGSLRRETAIRGIPYILFEAGQINRFERGITDIGMGGILGVLSYMKMVDKTRYGGIPEPSRQYFSKSHWVRASNGGLFLPGIFPGDIVKPGDILGNIYSIHGDIKDQIKSDVEGKVIGFNLHPQVVPGRALYNIGYDPV
jgi:hypothetical protein